MPFIEPIVNPGRHSAVVVLKEAASNSLILTKRSAHLKRHSGEICFPGGFWEPGDCDFYQTAIRELREELGIDEDRLTKICEMGIESTPMGSIIHPWLVSIDTLEPVKINFDEISRVIQIPYDLIQDPANYSDQIVHTNGIKIKTSCFFYADDMIWGVTVRIMKQLIS